MFFLKSQRAHTEILESNWFGKLLLSMGAYPGVCSIYLVSYKIDFPSPCSFLFRGGTPCPLFLLRGGVLHRSCAWGQSLRVNLESVSPPSLGFGTHYFFCRFPSSRGRVWQKHATRGRVRQHLLPSTQYY